MEAVQIRICNCIGKSFGAVDGKLYAVKDNLCTRNITTTSGSKFLKGSVNFCLL